ncbi:hypothetical protein EAH87_05160 [Sphingomonas koreensis]|nr:hypothetical protein EAH87_05160 [Sphingomonas koreensis]
MKLRAIDWIWHIRGRVQLPDDRSSDAVFAQIDPLFRQPGTTRRRIGEELVFTKRDPLAQDRMAVFDGGIVRVERGPEGAVLRYHVVSRALLFCFLAPLLFLAFAQLTIAIGHRQKSASRAAAHATEKKDKQTVVPLNPIDKFLGAPAPEKPKEKGKDKGEDGKHDKAPSPTPAYVFAALFAILYLAGRILESRLLKSLFEKCLAQPRDQGSDALHRSAVTQIA